MNIQMLSKIKVAVFAIASLALIQGCGSGEDVGTVSGTVTLDGVPQPSLIVTFVPQAGGQTAIGRTDENGKYELYRRGEKGAVVGIYTVNITSVKEATAAPTQNDSEMRSDSDAYLQQAMGSNASDYSQAKTKEKIPSKYNTGSTLSRTVDSGSNTIDLELTSD